MNQNNYSHILIIKVWSNISETITDYGNIESIVKEQFLESKCSYEGIDFKWKKIELSPLDKAFGLSNIVIDTLFDSDEIILSAVSSTIKYIDKKLHELNKLNENDKIVFKLIKPLVERITISQNTYVL